MQLLSIPLMERSVINSWYDVCISAIKILNNENIFFEIRRDMICAIFEEGLIRFPNEWKLVWKYAEMLAGMGCIENARVVIIENISRWRSNQGKEFLPGAEVDETDIRLPVSPLDIYERMIQPLAAEWLQLELSANASSEHIRAAEMLSVNSTAQTVTTSLTHTVDAPVWGSSDLDLLPKILSFDGRAPLEISSVASIKSKDLEATFIRTEKVRLRQYFRQQEELEREKEMEKQQMEPLVDPTPNLHSEIPLPEVTEEETMKELEAARVNRSKQLALGPPAVPLARPDITRLIPHRLGVTDLQLAEEAASFAHQLALKEEELPSFNPDNPLNKLPQVSSAWASRPSTLAFLVRPIRESRMDEVRNSLEAVMQMLPRTDLRERFGSAKEGRFWASSLCTRMSRVLAQTKFPAELFELKSQQQY